MEWKDIPLRNERLANICCRIAQVGIYCGGALLILSMLAGDKDASEFIMYNVFGFGWVMTLPTLWFGMPRHCPRGHLTIRMHYGSWVCTTCYRNRRARERRAARSVKSN